MSTGIPGLDPLGTLQSVENEASDIIPELPGGSQVLGAASTMNTALWIGGGLVAGLALVWLVSAMTSREPASSGLRRYAGAAAVL